MFMARHTDQVLGAIIKLNTIKVVNMPPFGQLFPVRSLPYQKVFSNIAIVIRSGMVGHSYKYIPSNNDTPTTPIVASNSSMERRFITASSTPSRSWGDYCSTTQARMFSGRVASLPLFLVRLIICLSISFLLHTYIITQAIVTVKKHMTARICRYLSKACWCPHIKFIG